MYIYKYVNHLKITSTDANHQGKIITDKKKIKTLVNQKSLMPVDQMLKSSISGDQHFSVQEKQQTKHLNFLIEKIIVYTSIHLNLQ